jgi:hypothetical protein
MDKNYLMTRNMKVDQTVKFEVGMPRPDEFLPAEPN